MLLAHVSDPHVSTRADGGDAVLRCFEAVSRLQGLTPAPDAVLVSGDLTDNGTADEYAIVRDLLARLPMPVHVIPGNHDDAAVLLRELDGTGLAVRSAAEPDRCYYRRDYPEFVLLCCDSSVPGRPYGLLGETQLAWLEAALGDVGERRTFVAMHHPPVRTGIAVMDAIMLRDAADLVEVLGRHGHVERVLAGHVHRAITASLAGAVVSIAPSTYRQVQLDLDPDAESGAFVAEPPGVLLHRTAGTGTVTHLLPVRHTAAPTGRI